MFLVVNISNQPIDLIWNVWKRDLSLNFNIADSKSYLYVLNLNEYFVFIVGIQPT